MKTDLALIAAVLSIALMSGLAVTDVFCPADLTSFEQHIGLEVPR